VRPSAASTSLRSSASSCSRLRLVSSVTTSWAADLRSTDPIRGSSGGLGSLATFATFAPDTLEWESLGFGHGVRLSWIAAGRTAEFYETLRWPTWREETAVLALSQGISVIPFPWTKEAHADLAGTSRRPCRFVNCSESRRTSLERSARLPAARRQARSRDATRQVSAFRAFQPYGRPGEFVRLGRPYMRADLHEPVARGVLA